MNIKASVTGAFLAAVLSTTAFNGAFAADDTIKVGILHSLSGTMAISETTLKDAMLMLIDEEPAQRRLVSALAARGCTWRSTSATYSLTGVAGSPRLRGEREDQTVLPPTVATSSP